MERVMKTLQAEKFLVIVVVIFELWRLVVAL
jgi:hypothetical protein